MNIRCAFCQTPYTLSRVDMLDALQEMEAQKLTHYDAHCPRCRRATQIPRQRMEMFMPNWRDELKAFEAEMTEHPQQEAPLPTHEPASVAPTDSTPAPKTVQEKKPAAKPKPAPAAKAKKPAATATAPKGKKTTKKRK
jgi:phage FluMu protein Com